MKLTQKKPYDIMDIIKYSYWIMDYVQPVSENDWWGRRFLHANWALSWLQIFEERLQKNMEISDRYLKKRNNLSDENYPDFL